MFAAPGSSSPPSTPDKSQYDEPSNLSTTPAGPPPNSSYTAASFTPRGPPPSSVFGSSQLRPGQSSASALFGTPPAGTRSAPRDFSFVDTHSWSRTKNGTPGRPIPRSSAFTVPDDSPFQETDGEEEDAYEENNRAGEQLFGSSAAPAVEPRGLKRSNRGEPIGGAVVPSREEAIIHEESVIPGIAKSMAARLKAPSLHELDDMILRTEDLISDIYKAASKGDSNQQWEVLQSITRLADTWRKFATFDSIPGGIGPAKDASSLTKANYLGSLLLQIHHAPLQHAQDATIPPLNRLNRETNYADRRLERSSVAAQTPVPQALLEWLNRYHNPFPNELEEVRRYEPSSTAHDSFWDIVFSSVLRGRIVEVIRLLEEADFGSAQTAIDDGYEEPGYYGRHLISVGAAINTTMELLKSCPAATNQWDVKNQDWALFRHRAGQAMINLETFAEGQSRDRPDEDEDFDPINGRSKELSLSSASRRAESRVPWTVYDNLRTLYGQLRGSFMEITMAAQDWLEASTYLTVWWDGEDDVSRDSLSASRRSVNRPRTREVDINPLQAYKERLYSSYMQVTKDPEDAELTLDTSNPIQVGLACIFEGANESVVDLISKWSITIASALAEVGDLAGWLSQTQSASNNVMDEFDQSDLMVLSYVRNAEPGKWSAVDLLVRYAELLSQKPNIWSSDKRVQREGWELAVQVLSRIPDRQTANAKLKVLLDGLSLDTSDRVDKILNLCSRLGLDEPARNIAQRYAERLQETSSDYGSALLYYSRAHNGAKIKEVLNLLIAYSLVLSSAYPAQSDLDERLKHLLTSPRDSLVALSNIDSEAARLLSLYLSGYATLRKFYDLRDEEVNLQDGQKPEHRPLARKRAAAAALVTVIESASDSVRGGLYDPDADAVVQVDALLALFGEALPLLNRE
ncbi:MAG: hypothetical protein M1822_002609 [Bathelium mastoideum]|nr:MAG: hypothetical protein M1822_002609 [Bathelium mastoideum]